MSLIQTLMRRAVLATVACLCIALALALWRAQVDTEREARGSAHMAELLMALSSLQNVPASDLPAHLQSIRSLNASGGLRHVQLRILDAQGQELVGPEEEAPHEAGFSWLHPFGTVPDWRMSWTIERSQGAALTVRLMANPGSEQEEALSGVLGLLLIVCVVAAVLLLGIYASVRHAFGPLQDILAAIAQIEGGDTTRRLQAMSCRELDRVGSALNQLADALEAAQSLQRQLGARIQTLQEDERSQLALDLHDEFGQQVTGLRANVHWLIRRTEGQADIQTVLRELDQECARIQHGMRHMLQRLRPQSRRDAVDTEGLAAWLQSLIDGWQARAGNTTRLDLVCEVGDARIPAELAVSLYRMTQEALTNIARHAQATHASVRIWQEGQALHWQLDDDGVGLLEPEQAMLRGRGLAGLRERAWTHGGTLGIHSTPQGGMRLQARFALPAQEVRA